MKNGERVRHKGREYIAIKAKGCCDCAFNRTNGCAVSGDMSIICYPLNDQEGDSVVFMTPVNAVTYILEGKAE